MSFNPLSIAIAGLLICTGVAHSQEQPLDPEALKREVALDRLLSERGPLEDMQAAIKAAQNAGVSKQAILEARFLYHVDMLEDAAIAAMLPEFIEQQKDFKLEDSAIFALKEDWLSVIEYVKAIDALEKGDRDGFKNHIKEAFWLGPRQAAAFAPHIERLRHEEAMRAIKFDFNRSLAAVEGGAETPLQGLIEGRKALLLHFWSPNSRECVLSMPDFARTAETLIAQNLAVASLCPKRGPEASAIIEPYNKGKHGSWLVDADQNSLGLLLRVQNLPTMALIHPDGSVLFSGDPTDIQFWRALEKIAPDMKRPDSDHDHDE